MARSSTPRTTVSTALLAALCGSLIGLTSIALCAVLWRAGQPHLAALTSQTSLLLALACLAAFVLLAQPPGRHRVRVVADHRLSRTALPSEPDPVPVIALCAGGPLVTGAAAAVLLFH